MMLFRSMWFAAAIFLMLTAGAYAQTQVVQVSGKAEIVQSGVTAKAAAGQVLNPGDEIRVAGKGSVRLESESGRIAITVKKNTNVSYDGLVTPKDVPWTASRKAKQGGRSAKKGVPQFSCTAGEAEAQVTPGQPLNLLTPLIVAAVRGTDFEVKVKSDASSSVQVREGRVMAVNRTGQVSNLTGGMLASLSSDEYVRHLRDLGVSIAVGQDWRSLDTGLLDKLDADLFGGAFGDVQSMYNNVKSGNVEGALFQVLDKLKNNAE